MIGAIVGDIVGSRFEFNNIKSKDCDFFHPDCCWTDDSVMTLAADGSLIAAVDSELALEMGLIPTLEQLMTER